MSSSASASAAARDGATRSAKEVDPELEAAQAEERMRHEQREAEINASWSKTILNAGEGAAAFRGAQATVHVVGRAYVDAHVTGRAKEMGFESGSIFEDSRARKCPVMLLLGRGTLVPGLDRALLEMQVGEHAEVTVKPEGGYGAGGSVANPMVPGSAVLKYDVELLAVEKETELWDMSFEEKMKLALERRQRGNTLVGGGHYLMADAEYEQALRYLIFMPHPEPHQLPPIADAITAVHLNLAATKLRLGDEAGAIRNANDAIAKGGAEGGPYVSKAHYRLAQAHTQLGKYALAQRHLDLAEAAAAGDDAAVDGIRKERERLGRRQEKHQRDRRKAAARMVNGGAGEDDDDAADGAAAAAEGSTAAAGSKLTVGPVAWVRRLLARSGVSALLPEEAEKAIAMGVVGALAVVVALLTALLAMLAIRVALHAQQQGAPAAAPAIAAERAEQPRAAAHHAEL